MRKSGNKKEVEGRKRGKRKTNEKNERVKKREKEEMGVRQGRVMST